MFRFVMLIGILCLGAFGGEFADKSTQELLSIYGYVDGKKSAELKEELKKRYPEMSPMEKKQYEEKQKGEKR